MAFRPLKYRFFPPTLSASEDFVLLRNTSLDFDIVVLNLSTKANFARTKICLCASASLNFIRERLGIAPSRGF